MAALDNLVSIGAPGVKPWIVREGDNVALAFIIKYGGTAMDLTGVTGTCSIRLDYTSTSDLVTAAVSFPTPLTGLVRVALTAAQTTTLLASVPAATPVDQLEVQIAVYDVELQDGTNQVTIVGGTITLSREVTP